MDKLRWGVIGAGGIARRRTIPGMMLAENAELVAVMDIRPDVAESVRDEFGIPRACGSEEELLCDPEVEAVYIATPVVHHAAQVRHAADHGKHVLVEKPVAHSSEEAEAVVRYCRERGVLLGVGLMMRFGTHVRTMKELIAQGKIGRVVSAYSQFSDWMPDTVDTWFTRKEKAGGGCLLDMGVHVVDLMQYILNTRCDRVMALNETLSFSYDVEDSSTLLMRMENGAQCVVQTNFNVPGEACRWRLEFFGDRGCLMGKDVIGQVDGGTLEAVFVEQPLMDADPAPGILLPGEFGNFYTREIESFSDSVLHEKPLVVPAEEAVRVQRILEEAYRGWER